MTTIMFENNTLYADKVATNDFFGIQYRNQTKLIGLSNWIIGCAGDVNSIITFYKLFNDNNCILKKWSFNQPFSGLLFNGKTLYNVFTVQRRNPLKFFMKQYKLEWQKLCASNPRNDGDIGTYCIGSGAEYAWCAYIAGWNHENCIRYASEYDKYTGDNIEKLVWTEHVSIESSVERTSNNNQMRLK